MFSSLLFCNRIREKVQCDTVQEGCFEILMAQKINFGLPEFFDKVCVQGFHAGKATVIFISI